MLLDFTSTLHAKKSPMKTLFSIGGAGEDLSIFSNMVSSGHSRRSFIESSIEVARKFGFNGIDLDWNQLKTQKKWKIWASYSMNGGLRSIRSPRQWARPLSCSPRPCTSPWTFSSSIGRNLDWINAMCYDYHGGWETSTTGARAALFDPKSNVSTSYGLQSWITAGLPPSKLIMGLPLYGRTWQLKDPSSHDVGAPAVGVGPGSGDVLTYSMVEAFNRANNATVLYDMKTVSAYSVAGTSWIGYDDAKSTIVKIKFAQALGLPEYFFWAVNGDYN
ncbi:Class V chitinase CHIT5a [Camellia lanceoleosa]|uniref:Class V chitinase CHIT5a n=1 Tax=Camellia lanceoleosa TaxID=1840588 RepID=A0ACC0I2N7_9ERIC|nr:Class V chitinase CHIT5a [Camellia lanceoleosa]